jgi:hypothetical protein
LGAFRDAAGLVGLNLRSLLVFPLNRVVDFAAVDRDFSRGVDAEPDPVAANVDNRHDYIVADYDTFVALSGENQHNVTRSVLIDSKGDGRRARGAWKPPLAHLPQQSQHRIAEHSRSSALLNVPIMRRFAVVSGLSTNNVVQTTTVAPAARR